MLAPQRSPTVCAVVSSVAQPLLITVVCMHVIRKALCPYILDAQLQMWVSLEHAFTRQRTPLEVL